ncbi:HCNGP domain-containing protein [Ceratobasidium sp. AG-Ba]|nr:HCNGP domain-containing protein [Ceratobasidium sp. AG-Ba]
MQSIVGYSDDDHSGDELKQLSPPRALSKPESKDPLVKPMPSAITTRSNDASSSSLPNEPRIRQETDTPSEPKPVRSGKSKFGLNPSMIRRTVVAPSNPTKSTEQPTASTSTESQDPEQDNSAQQTPVEPSLQDLSLGPNKEAHSYEDELAQIRAMLQPPPIPGVENFGIPPPSEDKIDFELAAKVAKFLALKKQGTHFNDILMRNKSFNNPHIYAKLVDFVEVDETGTNFPKNIWNPHDIQPEWYADELGKLPKPTSSLRFIESHLRQRTSGFPSRIAMLINLSSIIRHFS